VAKAGKVGSTSVPTWASAAWSRSMAVHLDTIVIFCRPLEYPMRTSATMTARRMKVRRTNDVTRKITLLKRHYPAGTLSYLLWCREGCGQPSQWDRACSRQPTHLNKVQVHSPVIRGYERAARVIDVLSHSQPTNAPRGNVWAGSDFPYRHDSDTGASVGNAFHSPSSPLPRCTVCALRYLTTYLYTTALLQNSITQTHAPRNGIIAIQAHSYYFPPSSNYTKRVPDSRDHLQIQDE
jgi:hypothetical protein